MSRDSVSLGGIEYYVRNIVIAQPVSDFAAVIRIGEPTYETRQGAGYLVFDDLSGGPGVQRGLAREDLARYANTTGVDTRFPRQATLPLASEAASPAPGKPDTALSVSERTHARRTDRVFRHFIYDPLGASGSESVYDVLCYGHKIYYQRPADASLSWAGLDVGIDCILDMDTYTPVSGSYKGDEYIILVGKTGWRRVNLLA